MITIPQCRAARALLGWTQQDLSDHCHLSKTAINNFEKGKSDIKNDSLKAIKLAFEQNGIEFSGHRGVAIMERQSVIFEGDTAITELCADIENDSSMITHISFLNVTANTLSPSDHIQLKSCISMLSSNNITLRFLQTQLEKTPLGAQQNTKVLSQVPSNLINPIIIYGDKTAHISSDAKAIIISNSEQFTRSEQQRFDQLWDSDFNKEAKSVISKRA